MARSGRKVNTPTLKVEKNTRRIQYSPDKLKEAVLLVKEGESASSISKRFNIPRSTLLSKASGTRPLELRKPGPKPMLGVETEQTLVSWILNNSAKGYPLNKQSLLFSVKKLLIGTSFSWTTKNFNFKKGPGKSWLRGFMSRHKEICASEADRLNKGKTYATESLIRKWFKEVVDTLESNMNIFEDPRRIFTCDETAVQLEPKPRKAFIEKGPKNIYKISSDEDKENISVLICTNAAADLIPPMAVYHYQRIPTAIIQNAPPNWVFGRSDKECITAETFYEYITGHFEPFLKKNEIPKPVILILDGNKNHISLVLNQFCEKNGIITVLLPPGTSHILQPLDIAFFEPLKSHWKDTVNKFCVQNGRDLAKHDVARLLEDLLKEIDFTNSIKDGFCRSGLFPFNIDNVNYSKCVYDSELEIPPRENTDGSDESKRAESLKYLNQKLPIALVNEFEQNSPEEWHGDPIHTSLYKFWLHLKYNFNFLDQGRGILFNLSELNYEMSEKLMIPEKIIYNGPNKK